jgi:hypothetical protein
MYVITYIDIFSSYTLYTQSTILMVIDELDYIILSNYGLTLIFPVGDIGCVLSKNATIESCNFDFKSASICY